MQHVVVDLPTPAISAKPIGKRRKRARYVAAGCLIRKLMPRSDSSSPMMGIFGIEPKESTPSKPRPVRKPVSKRRKGSKTKSGSRKRNQTLAKRHIMAKRKRKAKKAKKAKKTKKRRRKKKKAM